MRTLPDSLFELVTAGDNVLVLCPPFVMDGSAACADLLTVESPDQENVLSITYTQSPSDRLALCQQYVDSHPADGTILTIEANTRSSAFTGTRPDELPAELRIEQVSSPADLTSLGVKITNQLDDWEAETPDYQIVACFHSVTSLLQYVDLQRAFKFLDVLTDRFADTDAIAHYHLDPSALEEQSVNRLSSLFDVVLEWENQDWTVRTR